MSTPILPFAVWAAGTNQNSIPANDNSLRNQILNGLVISDATAAQPGAPTEGDIYIMAATPTGAQWAAFTPGDLAIYSGGTWYAFAPVVGVVVNLAGALYKYEAGAWAAAGGGGGGGGDVASVNGETGTVVLGAADIGITDFGGHFTATEVEGALQELGAAGGVAAPAPTIEFFEEVDVAYDVLAIDAGAYLRFIVTGAKTLTFTPESVEPLPQDAEFTVANRAASGDLTLAFTSPAVGNAPAGGTLVLAPGMTVTVKRVGEDAFDVMGQTVAA